MRRTATEQSPVCRLPQMKPERGGDPETIKLLTLEDNKARGERNLGNGLYISEMNVSAMTHVPVRH